MELEFDALIQALPKRLRSLSLGQRLRIPTAPKPFVAPTLHLMQKETTEPLRAEVIFVKASAAVGKSTIANHLSSALSLPLLDLAKSSRIYRIFESPSLRYIGRGQSDKSLP